MISKSAVVVGLALLISLTLSCGRRQEQEATDDSVAKGVTVDEVAWSSIDDVYQAVGSIRSKTTSVMSSRIMGRVIAIHVAEGDKVRSGQVLVDIDNRDAAIQLQKSQAGLMEARQSLEEIDRSIAAGKSSKRAADATRQLAGATFARYKSLLERRSVSQQEFEEVQARNRVAEAEADRAEQMLKTLESRRSQVLSKIEQANSDIAAARVSVGYARLLSPINGVVTSKSSEIGQMATPGSPILTIEDETSYRLEVEVDESHLSAVKLGQHVKLQIDALEELEIEGRVDEIQPVSNPATRTSTVKIDLPHNSKVTLRSGLFGRAHFVIGQRRVITVPETSIVERGQLVGAYLVDDAGRARLRLIKTGKSVGDRREVLAGLNDGDRIVIGGIEAVREGVKVQ